MSKGYSSGIKRLFLLFLLLSLFINGIFGELVTLLSLLILSHGCLRMTRKSVGNVAFTALIVYTASFVLLFGLHLIFGINEDGNYIRQYGLTKCVIAPSVLYIIFSNWKKREELIKIGLMFFLLLNSVFLFYAIVFNSEPGELGSVNVISVLNGVYLPMIVASIFSSQIGGNQKVLSLVSFIFIIGTVPVYQSGTGIVLILGELVILLVYYCFPSRYINKSILLGILLAIFFAVIVVFLMQQQIVVVSNSVMADRGNIWNRAYSQFILHSKQERIIGTGNNIVKMGNKDLEAHSSILEIMMIFGYIGLAFFALGLILLLVALWKMRKTCGKRIVILVLMLFSYLVGSLIHPFFTGKFDWQVLSLLVLIPMFEEIRNGRSELRTVKIEGTYIQLG